MKKHVNKMVLGTAQFGMDYGIANVSGQPVKEEVFAILSTAWENGITRYDTAPAYGSEDLLGEFIHTNLINDDIKVLAKIPNLEGETDWKGAIERTLGKSLHTLGCTAIEALFFHRVGDSLLLLSEPEYFSELQNRWPIKHLGVSAYKPHEIERLHGCKFELAFQFPYNVLDRRFKNVSMPTGKRYARSIFLQGLLTSENGLRETAPKKLLNIQKEYRVALHDKGIDPVSYALSFVTTSDFVDHFLIGVDTVDQLNDIFNMTLYDDTQLNVVDSSQFELEAEWLDPRRWD